MISLVLRMVVSRADVYTNVRRWLEGFSAGVGVGERGWCTWSGEELVARGGDEVSDAGVGEDGGDEGLLCTQVDELLTLDTTSFSVAWLLRVSYRTLRAGSLKRTYGSSNSSKKSCPKWNLAVRKDTS